jgi:hypothetical protein
LAKKVAKFVRDFEIPLPGIGGSSAQEEGNAAVSDAYYRTMYPFDLANAYIDSIEIPAPGIGGQYVQDEFNEGVNQAKQAAYLASLIQGAAELRALLKALPSKTTTVLGALEDTAKFKGKPGYNVLDIPDAVYQKMTPAEFDRLNAEWLNAALQRGDSIIAVTDPAAHAQFLEKIRPGLSDKSRYLNLELPILEEFGATVPTQLSYPPVTPFILTPP